MKSKEVTIEECIEMFEMDRQRAAINDGMVAGFLLKSESDTDE